MTPFKPFFILSTLIWSLTLHSCLASIILEDSFNGTDPLTGASVHPNQWYRSSSNVTEANGSLKISTAVASTAWGQTLFSTSPSSAFNFFNQPITISVRDFSMGGTGVNESGVGQNFRIGLVAKNTSTTSQSSLDFYMGGNDGIALTISNGSSYHIRYKTNSDANRDPNLVPTALVGSAAKSFTGGITITGFDFQIASSTWALNLLLSDGSTSYNQGNWDSTTSGFTNLDNAFSTWGNEVDGWGSSALVMQAQKGNTESGSVYATIGSIVVTPEPGRTLLVAAGALLLCLRRSRQRV